MTRDFRTASEFVFKGHGVGLVPTFYCEDKIRADTLSRVLPEWTSSKFDVHAVYPMRKFLSSKLVIFLEELGKWKSPLGISGRTARAAKTTMARLEGDYITGHWCAA